ncbi:MAG: branched-chain amino acid ABC transporter permease [Microthrixaceae bacterium]|nr:branched-chain amino acid ABC transporter permease [Microthrixaceae bacterium]MCO5312650.1 branched-chain amino acid ABC transporter permease [Microthrixaceae bacterium]
MTMLGVNLASALIDGIREAIGPQAAYYALAAVGLNVQFGYAGLMNFGHIASALVGAYGAAITVDQGGSLWLGILIGVVCAGLLGLLMGLPTLRLRADYLAIATISVAEIVRVLVNSRLVQDVTGGPIGINHIADELYDINPIPEGRYGIGSITFNQNRLFTLLIGWTLVIAASLLVRSWTRSPWGRVLKAVREDEDATRSLGKNVFAVKLQAFVIGSVIGGVAGVIFMFDGGTVKPDFFLAQTTFNWYLVVILGGVASILGPPVGAMVFWFVIAAFNSILTQALGRDGWWIIEANDAGAIRYVLVGFTIVLLLIFRPQGLFGNAEEARIVNH